MKKKLIWILVLTLAAVMAVVGTVAYFSATDAVKNAVAVGDASIELVEFERASVNDNNTDNVVPFEEENKLLLPSIVSDGFDYKTLEGTVNWKDENGDEMNVGGNKSYTSSIWNPADINNELDKMVFVRNTGNTEVYVRVCFAFEAGNYVWKSHFDRMVHLNLNDTDWTWDWGDEKVVEINGTRYFIAWATYNKTLPGQQYTEISLSQIALDSSAISDHAKAFGDKYDVLVFAQGIQVEGFEGIVDGAPNPSKDAPAALNKGFGETIPFGDVKEVNFVDLPTALHYLNGEKKSENALGFKDKPNARVNSITFGLTKDHSAKVVGCEGVLVANKESGVDNKGNVTTPEADFTAYAYYVPNGENYDIYVLADNWEIYTPNDSQWLFAEKTGLRKVDTANLNVSKTRNMYSMFNRCKALETIDVSDWDVSNVTNMQYLFNQCGKLANIDVSDWDVSNVTYMNYMFRGCPITTLDVADWDVRNVKEMGEMFWECGSLTNLDLSTWETSSLTSIEKMFQACGALTDLNISTWDVSKVTNMSQAFYSCESLPSLDLSSWNMSSATTMAKMFYACHNLVELKLPEACNPSSLTNMTAMFRDCYKLASLDLSRWDTSKVTHMNEMFYSCGSLSSLKLPNDVSKVTTMQSMFERCTSLTVLDLSAWNTENLVNTECMFSGCGMLTTIYVGDHWNMTKVTSSGSMFENCYDLVSGSSGKKYTLGQWNATHAHTGADGYLTDIADKPANP